MESDLIRRFSSLQGRLDRVFLTDRLTGAKAYRRIAGYFRSSLLELVGEQIAEIRDVRIVCNSDLDPADINVSKAARDAALKGRWNDVDLGKESLLNAERYKRLYDLLTSGRVQIKVVPKEMVFVHGKAGVIELADGTCTAFIGSSNDSRNAFSSNYEIIWEDSSKAAVEWVDQEFEALWRMGHDLPDAIIIDIKRLADRVEVKFADLKPEDLPAAVMVESPIYRSGEQLQPWQRAFVATFLKHRAVYGKARLLIADEVGLGKTLSMATAALVATLLDDGPVLILCPATLVYQWQTELQDRLDIPSAVWDSVNKAWIDPQGRINRTRGFQDVCRCPYRIAIVSTGLITAGSPEATVLQSQHFGTLVLDEAHKARLKAGLGAKEDPNNLLAFMRIAARNARHIILGTATPIQTSVRELWDLVEILSVNAEFVLGRQGHSRWRQHESTLGFVNGSESTSDPALAWDLLRSPLPPPEAPMLDGSARRLSQSIRDDLDLSDKDYFTARSHTDLSSFTRRGDFEDTLSSDFFRRNNPFVRHVVLRRRRELEDAGLLERISVNVHPDLDAKIGTYPGVTFVGRGLMTDFAFESAYDHAEAFIAALALRTRSAGLLKSVFLQRICSSYASGLATVTRMIQRQADPEAEGPMQELELGILQSLEPQELSLLFTIRDLLTQHKDGDPKFKAVKWFLQDFRSPSAKGASWSELGCIVFTQYFDTAAWVGRKVALLFPDQVVAVYAGAGRSGLFRGNKFVSEERDVIKKMVRERSIKLVIATDAACEGLNLQALGTLINIDLPWNPSRLEQRLGRIKRIGQARDSVDMLNLVYHGTRDEKVYETLSSRMKDRFDIFGGLPDCIDADWIDDIQEFEQLAETHLHLRSKIRNIFQEKWGETALYDKQDWESCERVLARSDIIERMSRGW